MSRHPLFGQSMKSAREVPWGLWGRFQTSSQHPTLGTHAGQNDDAPLSTRAHRCVHNATGAGTLKFLSGRARLEPFLFGCRWLRLLFGCRWLRRSGCAWGWFVVSACAKYGRAREDAAHHGQSFHEIPPDPTRQIVGLREWRSPGRLGMQHKFFTPSFPLGHRRFARKKREITRSWPTAPRKSPDQESRGKFERQIAATR